MSSLHRRLQEFRLRAKSAQKKSLQDDGSERLEASAPQPAPQPQHPQQTQGPLSTGSLHQSSQQSVEMDQIPLPVVTGSLSLTPVPFPTYSVSGYPSDRNFRYDTSAYDALRTRSSRLRQLSSTKSMPLSSGLPPPPEDRRCNNTRELRSYPGFRSSTNFKSLLNKSYRQDSCLLHFRANWAISAFCRQQLPSYPQLQSDLPLVLTMTKSADGRVQTASCEDYTKMVWGDRGDRILRSILAGVNHKSCRIREGTLSLEIVPSSHLGDYLEKAQISLNGALHDVADVLEQIAWMASTFRPPGATLGTYAESKVRLVMDSVGGHHLLLEELTPPPAPRFPLTSCWTLAIPTAVIASEFPVRRRHGGRGIEISFELMASLLKVSTVSEIQGHQVLVGASNVLVPLGFLPQDGDDAVQWHCYSIKNLAMSELDNILNGRTAVDKPMAELAQLRCFLGFFERAVVHLGTDEIPNQVIRETNLGKSNQRLELAREVTFSTGFSIPGIINGTVGGKVILQKSLQVALDDRKEYHDLLTDSKLQSVVLYDVEAQIGWLVSELSIVLHLVLLFLNLPDTMPRYQGNPPKLRYSPANRDGGQAALDFIYEHGDLPLWGRPSTTEQKLLRHVVNDFLRSVRALGNASILQQNPKKLIKMAELRGWEFTDILSKKSLVDEKQLPSGDVPCWWRLCGEGRVYAVFETGLGQVIRPTCKVPPGWRTVLEGAGLLVASMPCIRRLHQNPDACAEQERGYRITRNLVWDPRGERCKNCDLSCEDFIQNLRPSTMFDKVRIPSIALRDPDAIIIGDHQRFHEVVRQLGLGTHRLDRILKRSFRKVIRRVDVDFHRGPAKSTSRKPENTIHRVTDAI